MAARPPFSDVIESLISDTEAKLRERTFNIQSAKRLICDLCERVESHRLQGDQENEMENVLLARVSRMAEEFLTGLRQSLEICSPYQMHLFVLSALAVFPASVRLGRGPDSGLVYSYTPDAERCLIQLDSVRSYCHFVSAEQPLGGIQHYYNLLELGSWLERRLTPIAYLIQSKLFFALRAYTDILHTMRMATMPFVEDLKIVSYTAGIQRVSCLLREGHRREAKELFEGLPRANRFSLPIPPPVSVKREYVTSCIMHDSGDHVRALNKAQEVLTTSEDPEDTKEIKDLIQRIKTSIADSEQKAKGPADEDWLEGTNAHSTELLTNRQNQRRQNHQAKPRHKRPKRAASETRVRAQNSASSSRQPQVTQNITGQGQSDPNLLGDRIRTMSTRSCPSPDLSPYQGALKGACSTPDIFTQGQEDAEFRKMLRSKKFEEDSDEEQTIGNENFGVIGFGDDFEDDADNASKMFPTAEECETVDNEIDWYALSDQATGFEKPFDISDIGDKREISEYQMRMFEKKSQKGRLFYGELIRDTDKLEKLLKDEPNCYKRCHLKIDSSHRSIAKVLDDSSKFSEIQISGRSKCKQTFTDDEVVVKVLAEPAHVKNGTSSARTNTNSGERMAHGEVIGLLNRVNHPDINHSVLLCTLDEFEGHLMKPLCRTVPKIHVLNDTVREQYPSLTKHKIEIKEISESGNVEHKGFVNVRPEKRGQYVFAVMFLTWSPKKIYPQGAVLGWQVTGTGYSGAEMVLTMQHRVPTTYPEIVVEDTKSLVQKAFPEGEVRENITDKRVFTIDPHGAKDLDDALSIWKEGTHYVVGIHIADVAAVVKEDSSLDDEARRRAITFYPLHRKPHHMLPEPLSQGICSLLPNTERRTLSVFYRFNDKFNQAEEPEIKRTLITSCQQLTYEDVQGVICGSQQSKLNSNVCSDIVLLNKIASKLREGRLQTSRLFVPFDDPRLVELDKQKDTRDAHALVEQFMILTNSYIAKLLRTTFPKIMILRCHKGPSYHQLAEWHEKEGGVGNLSIKLQGKNVKPETKLSFQSENNGSHNQGQHVIINANISKRLCRHIENEEVEEARRIAFMDDLHPLQCLANNHWMEMTETAQYKCSHGLNPLDHVHFDMDLDYYTHFTSPIRRYVDLYVQRLVHAYLDSQTPSCTPDDVKQLCQHINSATARQKAFGKACLSLKIADSLQLQPLVFRAFVDQVDSEQLTLLMPSLKAVSDRRQELPFSLMGVCSQPEVVRDTAKNKDSVTVKWNTRICKEKGTFHGDFAVKRRHFERQAGKSRNSPIVININPHILSVFLKQSDWTNILKFLADPINHPLKTTPSPFELGGPHVDYMSSEKGDDTVSLRPCQFEMVYSPGQILQVQMSAESQRGILKPCMDLLHTARNSSVCLRHKANPVSALYRTATQATRGKQFTRLEDYRAAWMPLLEMEAAYNAVDGNSGCVVENVAVSMRRSDSTSPSGTAICEGFFSLDAAFCDDRCIDIGGRLNDNSDDTGTKYATDSSTYFFPLDYLCIRYQTECRGLVVSRMKEFPVPEAVDRHYTWIGHAGIMHVKYKPGKKETENTKGKDPKNRTGRLHATFMLSQSSPPPPDHLLQKTGDVTVEILPKTEVDRRTQLMLLLMDEEGCELSRAVAFGAKLPKLDKDHKRLGGKSENHEMPMKGLPWNNPPQLDAIRTALTHPVSVIQGPPGTGKTYTGIKLVYLFCKINRQLEKEGKGKKTVLFCGPSNKSVDLVARLLRDRLGPDCPSLIRMYGSAIEFKDYPVPNSGFMATRGMRDLQSDLNLQAVSLHHVIREDGKPHAKEIATFETHFKKHPDTDRRTLKKYYKLLYDASVEELRHYEVVLTTCATAGSGRLIEGLKGTVFQVIIDECAMSPEPHSLVPIIATKAQQVVLIGDHKQLRPIIKCSAAAELGLEQSLFERLYMQDSSKIPRVFLSKQYRMHPRICEFPSHKFYEGMLETAQSRHWQGEPLPFWPHMEMTGESIPHLLVHVSGTEETLPVSTEEGNERSKSNAKEAEKVIEIFTYLKKEHGIDTFSIRVLTQYNAQRHLIEEKLKKLCDDRSQNVFDRYDKNKINVTTVVSSQGDEWDYVILSTVRSLPPYKIEPNPTRGWCIQNLGFITDCNQVNVALTRARRGLIIVGNVELLRCDDVWRDLVERYEGMNCVVKAENFPPPPPPPLRRSKHPRRNPQQGEWKTA